MDGDVLVLWDIDGTLLNAGGVGRDLYDKVFAQLFGRSLDACAPMAGRTDRAIILETLTLAGVDEPRRYVDPFIAGLGAHAPTVGTAVAERGQPLPGATEALAALVAASGTTVRAATSATCTSVTWTAGAPTVATDTAAPGTAILGPAAGGGAGPTGAGTSATALRGPVAPGTAAAVPAAAGVPAPRAVTTSPPVPSAAPPAVSAAAPRVVTTSPPVTSTAASGPAGGGGSAAGGRPSRRVHQSVLTGNIRLLAEVKLAALGLRDGLDLCIGAYGDDHEDRAELVQVARRRAAGVHGRTPAAFAGTSTVVVGDTPLDVAAALSAGARAVGV
ncbi:MAG TPA: hypothetical protein VH092_12640, partial [Urbifossiella sp.]|nr:hypothetical protein [Urbifossiella sp.]